MARGGADSFGGVAASPGSGAEGIRGVLAWIMAIPGWWIVTMLFIGLLSCFAVGHPASGGVRVSFEVGTTAVIAFGLIWLPALVRLLALTGGRVKAAGIEASSGGLLGTSDELIRELAEVLVAVEEVKRKSPEGPDLGSVTDRIDDIAGRFVAGEAITPEVADRLGREYERIRDALESSGERTSEMTRVVNEARVRAIADGPRARDLGLFLVRSRREGGRIVGLAFLQEAPDAGAFGDVLAMISGSATAFEMYQALLTLRAIGSRLTNPERDAAIAALKREESDPRSVGVMDDTNLPYLLKAVREELEDLHR